MIVPILPQDVARCIGHGAGPSGYQNRIDDEPEEWRPLFGRYCISSLGRVRGMHKIRKMQLGTSGYPIVQIKGKTYMVHRLVAQTFLTPDPDRPMVNHKDGVKTNNRVSNLEWCTKSENALHSYRLGMSKPPRPEGNPKVTPEQVREIRKSDESVQALAERYGLAHTSIRNIKAGRTWKDLPD